MAGFISDRVLQKKIVHENTWHNAITYHWDFSIRDYQAMVRRNGARVVDLTSRGFFFPRSLLRGRLEVYRAKKRILRRLPLLRYFGEDLVLVAEKR